MQCESRAHMEDDYNILFRTRGKSLMLYMHGFLIILHKHFKDKTFESREDNIYITGSELLPRPCVLELKSWNKIENHEKMPIQALMQDLWSFKETRQFTLQSIYTDSHQSKHGKQVHVSNQNYCIATIAV